MVKVRPTRRRAAGRRRRLDGRRRRRRSEGYNLVILAMAVTVLNIMIAAALPAWSHLLQRYKEEELIFRGLQYAEAIRVFQQRHGRLPNKLEELIEVKPRCIRQLWTNPLTEDGSWLLVPANQPIPGRNLGGGVGPQTGPQGRDSRQRPGGRRPGGRPGAPGTTPRKDLIVVPGESSRVTVQFIGVASPEGDEAIKTFNNSTSIADWQFRVELLKAGQVAGGNTQTPGVPKPVNSGSFWKPFPPGVTPPQAGPGAAPPGTPPKPPQKPPTKIK